MDTLLNTCSGVKITLPCKMYLYSSPSNCICVLCADTPHPLTRHFSFLLKVIAAEGEMNASRALKEASLVIAESPSALQLRYLQTLNTIAAEKNSTIIFPLPLEMMHGFMKH